MLFFKKTLVDKEYSKDGEKFLEKTEKYYKEGKDVPSR